MKSTNQNTSFLKIKLAILLVLMTLGSTGILAENLKKVMSLEGSWRF